MTSRLKRNSIVLGSAIALIGAWEGLRTVAYRDPIGIPTICFGETRNVKMGDVKTKDECRKMLGDRLLEFERGMRACLKDPDKVPDGAYVAALSLSYNIGTAAFCKSSVRKFLDAGSIGAACDALLRFVKAGGITFPGLVNRRKAEREICLNGVK